MLFKKNFQDIGDIDPEKLKPLSELEEKGKITNFDENSLPKDLKEIYQLILKMKRKEKHYNVALIALIVMNMFLTGIIIYLGIVKIL